MLTRFLLNKWMNKLMNGSIHWWKALSSLAGACDVHIGKCHLHIDGRPARTKFNKAHKVALVFNSSPCTSAIDSPLPTEAAAPHCPVGSRMTLCCSGGAYKTTHAYLTIAKASCKHEAVASAKLHIHLSKTKTWSGFVSTAMWDYLYHCSPPLAWIIGQRLYKCKLENHWLWEGTM